MEEVWVSLLTVFLSRTVSFIPSSEWVSRDAAGSPPPPPPSHVIKRQLLDLGDVVVGEKSLLSTKSSCPPPRGIYPTDMNRLVSSFNPTDIFTILRLQQPFCRTLTLFDNVDEVVSVEAELVCVLSIVGVQSFALWHLGFGFRRRFGSSSSRRRPAGGWSVGSETLKGKKEGNHTTVNICRRALQDMKDSVHCAAVAVKLRRKKVRCLQRTSQKCAHA